jgi:hypothetical protein
MWPRLEGDRSILLEAEMLVNGPRQVDYDHPKRNFARIAAILNVVLHHRLLAQIEPEDVGMMMIAVKLARQTHRPQRDNLVDIAGYAETISRIQEGR